MRRLPTALALCLAAPALAQPAGSRADALVAILNGGAVGDHFTPAFLSAVPEAQLRAIAAQLTAAYGPAGRIARIVPVGGGRFALTIAYATADVAATMTLEPAAPHRIAGLVISGGTARLPTLAAAIAALRALPGTTGLAVTRLDGAAPVTLADWNADRPQAVASGFKLLVLAALVRSIDAGERRWADVVPLTVRALPSGILQDWPENAQLTLHSLTTLMLSRSDNSATDTLIALLGRDRVAAMAPTVGWAPHPANDPLLTTLDLARLKGGTDQALADRYAAATPPARRALLAGPVAAIPRDAIDVAALDSRPQQIDTLEWQASPAAMVRTLDWFRRTADRPNRPGNANSAATALALLAVNPGLPRTETAAFAYVGYKGGSEAGVLALHYLLRTTGGRWYAVAASWNDPRAVLAEQRLVALVTRVVALVAADDGQRPHPGR